jgi:hypothetical protein
LKAARKETMSLLGNGIIGKKNFDKKLKKIRSRFDMTKLEVQQKGSDYEIYGKINPEYKDYVEKVTILSKKSIETEQEGELESFFRAISIKELEKIKKGGLIKPRSNDDDSQKGEFGLTTNKEYAVNNIVYSKSNKNVNGKLPQANAKDAKYVVIIEIRVPKGTQESLKDKYGRKQRGQQESHPLTETLPVLGENEKNVITMKVETVKGGGENINFMITSKSPGEISEGDPLFDINNAIVDIKIIGGIIDG